MSNTEKSLSPFESLGRQRLESFREACLQAGCNLRLGSSTAMGLARAFAFSEFAFRSALGSAAVLAAMIEDGSLWQHHEAGRLDRLLRSQLADLGGSDWSSTLAGTLRRFRKNQMLRIAVCDIAGWMPLDQVLAEVSDVAQVCLQVASETIFRNMAARFGNPLDGKMRPVVPVVLGLGKLGGRELNFSSDIDLVFAYSREGETSGGPGGSIGCEEFFQRFFRELIRAIGRNSAEGFVFRVDTRLRPFGEVGPLAMSFSRIEDYYQRQGREWERYALIKARAVAGDLEAGRRLLRRLKPFVYRRYLDYGVFEALREMKAKIMAEVRARGLEDDIKLGPGGIREIEFFGQVFQLLRGGVQPAFQRRSILKTLACLAEHGAIDSQTMVELTEAYRFLRIVENRLQQREDRQTHKLPPDEQGRLRLAFSLGFATVADFEKALDRHRGRVQRHFDFLLDEGCTKRGRVRADDAEQDALARLCMGGDLDQSAHSLLDKLGYQQPAKVLEVLDKLLTSPGVKRLSQAGRIKLRRLLPLLISDVAAHAGSEPELVFSRLMDLLTNIVGRVPYLALLIESATARAHLIRLTGASSWIARYVARHPVLLDELMDPRTLYEPLTRSSLAEELERGMDALAQDDLEQQMDVLRVFKQVNTLRVAAADITGVLPLMKVSDRLSDLAETVLEKVLDLCWRQLTERHGRPKASLAGTECGRGFAVVAYGKLGGLELGYGSDLDLVFLHSAIGGTTDGPRPMDCAHFYARLGQRMLHMLTAHTAAGILYQADMRLRPSGDSGMLVSHLEAFARYQEESAWTWEHQALVRARAVAGDPVLQEGFQKVRRRILTIERDPDHLRSEVVRMREKLRQAQDKSGSGRFDLKQGFGGMVDIEFLVQYLVLQHAFRFKQLVRWPDNVRLLQSFTEAGLMDPETAYLLRRAYLIYRAQAHRCNLQERPAIVEDGHFEGLRRTVQAAWRAFMLPA